MTKHCGETSLHDYKTQQLFPADIPIIVTKKLSQSTCCSRSCVPGGCQRTKHRNTKPNRWDQHGHLQRYHENGDEFLNSIIEFHWEVFDQPTCSLIMLPAIAIFSYTSRNSYLISIFKVMKWCRWLSHTGCYPRQVDFYNTGIQILIPCYDECLNFSGKYVEK
ncbi:hypothetical protein PR048_012241 [Dryococelus australis]|uniref:Uncharacterized protein n=1 Tax=Dryococelus australis TaxID=614101 RepID=A0ABQ9HNT7_9NEOP|nr:hypothetical protein PR048_012241 [Dryococelus australis]